MKLRFTSADPVRLIDGEIKLDTLSCAPAPTLLTLISQHAGETLDSLRVFQGECLVRWH